MFAEFSEYRVLARKQETPTTVTLSLSKINGMVPYYHPGQYLTVYFPDFSYTLGKQYSISSAPSEKICTITVKAIGMFSNRLCSLSPGDIILASDPQGFFYPTQYNNIFLLAGGMGITPFRSIVLEALAQRSTVHIELLYSAKTVADMPFSDELHTLSREYESFNIERFVTKESCITLDNMKCGHIQIDDITKTCDPQKTEFLISGPLSFVLELKNILVTAGAKHGNILTEACDI